MTAPQRANWIPAAVLGAVVVLSTVVMFFFGSTPARREDDDSSPRDGPRTQTYERTITDLKAPPSADDELTSDVLREPHPAFDPARFDRRPEGEWLVNSSAAVLKLDLSLLHPESDADLSILHPSYTAAIRAVRKKHGTLILPSVNMVEGKIKQFDDGLYAALDLAHYTGLEGTLLSHVELFKRIHAKLDPKSAAAAFFAAGLELAGVKVQADDAAAKARFADRFAKVEIQSKPVGFYTWSDELRTVFRFLRFFQQEFSLGEGGLGVPVAVAAVLEKDAALAADYRKAIGFYAKLTNPPHVLSAADLIGANLKTEPPAGAETDLAALAKKLGVPRSTLAVFPGSTSRETVLFDRLFGESGLPPDANLMRELVRAIRSGKVDLAPKAGSGWYDHQVFALETFLLPGRGPEGKKLLLSKEYKKRMLEAFAAIITTRRETHVRGLGPPAYSPPLPPPILLRPRLRVEPAPTFYLRTARSYDFLHNFLEAAMGREVLDKLHGLREVGPRPVRLGEELLDMRDLCYGLYLVSCDDIGLALEFRDGEPVDANRCYTAANRWLGRAGTDPDLAVDTRVAVPLFIDRQRNVVRCWATAGVRMVRLDVGYEIAPQIRPREGEGKWESATTRPAEYLLPVAEFVEFELTGSRVLNRTEWRNACERGRTKEGILKTVRGS